MYGERWISIGENTMIAAHVTLRLGRPIASLLAPTPSARERMHAEPSRFDRARRVLLPAAIRAVAQRVPEPVARMLRAFLPDVASEERGGD